MTFSFERTWDWDEIKRILCHEKVYGHISDDLAPKRENFEPSRDSKFWYVLVKVEDEVLGIWVLLDIDGSTFEVHTCLLPASYGRAALAGRAFLRWVWQNVPQCGRLVTAVPEFNRLALVLAKGCGMEETRRESKTYLKNDQQHDVIFLELRRPQCL